jgi:3-isopropylmalate dehydrogenase
MSTSSALNIAVFPGDGIGVEVADAALIVLDQAQRLVQGFRFNFQRLRAGAFCYRETGEALPREALDEAARADAVLLGASGWPDIRCPDGTEIRPQLELRFTFDLYAGVRPIRFFPGTPSVLNLPENRSIDFVIVRESTEGLFASRGSRPNPEVATETMIITRRTTDRLMRFSYGLAQKRKARGYPGKVTCVDKSNVFTAMAFFRRIYDEVGEKFSEIEKEYCYVDAMALNMVLRPWEYDVMVMENMFGDILSDLGAGIIGGMGMAPSADIGDERAVFQPSHGSAPDIAGRGIANPIAMILSAAMMCDYLADISGNERLRRAGRLIESGVEQYLQRSGKLPFDQGGDARTGEVVDLIIEQMESAYSAEPSA